VVEVHERLEKILRFVVFVEVDQRCLGGRIRDLESTRTQAGADGHHPLGDDELARYADGDANRDLDGRRSRHVTPVSDVPRDEQQLPPMVLDDTKRRIGEHLRARRRVRRQRIVWAVNDRLHVALENRFATHAQTDRHGASPPMDMSVPAGGR
jgi:hypothetical protein